MKKKRFLIGMAAATLGVCLLFGGCGSTLSVLSVEKTATDGLTDTYTITYSDGSKFDFTVTNGKDGTNGTDGRDGADGKDGKDGENGTNGESFNVAQAFALYQEKYPGSTYQDFLGNLSSVAGVLSVEKTATDGLTDTYTITYSDGSEYDFTVTNGKDGENGKDGTNGKDGENGADGKNFSVADAFALYQKERPDCTYEEFLSLFLLEGGKDTATVVNRTLLSAAKIYTEFPVSVNRYPYPATKDTAVSKASAVIYQIDSDYTYFLTNYHVVYYSSSTSENHLATKYTVYLYGSEGAYTKTTETDKNGYPVYSYSDSAISCELVGGSVTADLAVLRAPTDAVQAVNPDATAIEFAEDYHVGETAIAVGNSEDKGISATQGIVSVDSEYIILSIDKQRQYRSMRMDAAIYEGNSGGGLFNAEGKLIGLNNAGEGTNLQNINYAIPLSVVRSVAENIMHYCIDSEPKNISAKKILIGITVTSENSRYVYDAKTGYGKIVEEVVISELSEPVSGKSIAQTLDLKKGDIIRTFNINGKCYEIDRYFNLGDLLYRVYAGDEISVTYLRDGKEHTSAVYTVQTADLNSVD